MRKHPLIAFRDCQHCQVYHYDEETGKPYDGRDGSPAKRHRGCPPPCRTAIGCPKGTPENSNALSERNQLAYDHYKTCRATGAFPDDPIVQRNAALFREMEEIDNRRHQQEVSALLKGLIGVKHHS